MIIKKWCDDLSFVKNAVWLSFFSSVAQSSPTLCNPMDCSSPTSVYSNSCPLSRWYHPTISSSVALFSCLQSFPASGSFQGHSSLTIFANADKHANQFYKIRPNSSLLAWHLSWDSKASEIPLLTLQDPFTFRKAGHRGACLFKFLVCGILYQNKQKSAKSAVTVLKAQWGSFIKTFYRIQHFRLSIFPYTKDPTADRRDSSKRRKHRN